VRRACSRPKLDREGGATNSPTEVDRVRRSRCPSGHEPITSQGTARGRFARANKRRHLNAAEMAAREMAGTVARGRALPLCADC
jgi:hypothetical protein